MRDRRDRIPVGRGPGRCGEVLLTAAIASVLLLLASGCGEQPRNGQSPDTAGSPSIAISPTPSVPAASPTNGRATYEWVDNLTPADTYTVAFVRGLNATEALSALGDARRVTGSLNAKQVLDLASDLTNPHTYETPPIVQIGELDDGVIVYSPYGFRPVDRLGALSIRGVAAAFTTSVELDTSIAVAAKGQLIREFDPFFYDDEERRGALPQEQEVEFSDVDGFSPAWRFLDRVTRLHVGRDWFLQTPHPTYILTGES